MYGMYMYIQKVDLYHCNTKKDTHVGCIVKYSGFHLIGPHSFETIGPIKWQTRLSEVRLMHYRTFVFGKVD